MADHPEPAAALPDYPLADALTLDDPAQYRALFEETRQRIIALLSERAATISELADAIGRPKGTIGHHVQVLADAGLIRVVRTKQVRAVTAKYWGRTARVFYFERVDAAVGDGRRTLEWAAAQVGRLEAGAARPDQWLLDVNRRDVRIPPERAAEFAGRLADLLLEFAEQPRSGDVTYSLVYGLFRSDLGVLPDRPGA